MKYVILLMVFFIFLSTASAQDAKEDILSLTKEINRFEKEVPFFTKSKVSIILKCDTSSFSDTFYGVYLNENLVKAGQINDKTFPVNKDVFVGDYPVHPGSNVIKLRIYKDGQDVYKKFQVDIPEYRRVALQLIITDSPQKPKVVTKAWVIE